MAGFRRDRVRETRAEGPERLAALLQDKHDVDCEVFHAGRTGEALARTQGNWAGGDLHCVVATVAFGMGVDKADVSVRRHWGPPTTLEGLYQESGLAGRDSKPALCVMVRVERARRARKVTGGGGDVEATREVESSARLLEHGRRAAGGCGEGEESGDVRGPRRRASRRRRRIDIGPSRGEEDGGCEVREEDTHAHSWQRRLEERRVEVVIHARRVPLVPTQHRPPAPPGDPLDRASLCLR